MTTKKPVSRFALSRRTMVRGMVGGAVLGLALPPLEAMFDSNGVALAGGEAVPRRFGFFYWGNGVKGDRWTPGATGAGYPLTNALEPLSGVRDYVSVVSGMNIRTGNERGHHAGTVGILSGAPMIPQDPMGAGYASTFSGPSIDQVIATAVGTGTRFRSLEVGVDRRVVTGEGTTLRYLSHNGPDNVNPPSYVPSEVFTRVFGTGFTEPGMEPMLDPRLGLRRSVLDSVMGDARRLQDRVGTADRARLDQHWSSVRDLERRIAMLEATPPPPPSACELPTAPATFDDGDLMGINRAMCDLIAMAAACDQTRVFTNMFNGSVAGTIFPGVETTIGHHSLTHDEPGNQPLVAQATRFIIGEFAYMIDALRRIPEGDGNVLDNSVILASTDTGDGQGHTIDDYPILVAGRGGGALVHPGIHHRAMGNNTSEVLLTCIRAMGIEAESFGEGGGHVTTSVSAIET